jgi:hypothetical protein
MIDLLKNQVNIAIRILRFPNDFFKDLKKEKGFKKSLIYLAFLWAVNTLLLFATSVVLVATRSDTGDWTNALPMAITYFVVGGLIGYVTSLGIALIIHLYSKLFRGKGKIYQSFQLSIYASTPTLLFGWVPIASFLATLYLIYLLYTGAIELHGFTKRRSMIAFIIIPLILIIASVLIPQR